MIASLLDCHGAASAAAFAYRDRGRTMGDGAPAIRFVTASLKVDFKRPTPLGGELIVKGRLTAIDGRKATIALSLQAGDELCAVGEMIAVEYRPKIDSVADQALMKILVIGSTGPQGREFVAQALAAGHAVCAFARNPAALLPAPGLEVVRGDVFDQHSLDGFVRATAGRLRWAQHAQTQAAIRPRGRATRPTRQLAFVCRPGG